MLSGLNKKSLITLLFFGLLTVQSYADENHYELALKAYQQKDVNTAEIHLKNALKENTKNLLSTELLNKLEGKKIFSKIIHFWDKVETNFKLMDLHNTALDDNEISYSKIGIPIEERHVLVTKTFSWFVPATISLLTSNV